MDKEIEKLFKMKETVQKKNDEKNRIKGALESALQELKDRDNINTLEDLSNLIDKKEKELDKLEKELKEGIEELEEKYDWD